MSLLQAGKERVEKQAKYYGGGVGEHTYICITFSSNMEYDECFSNFSNASDALGRYRVGPEILLF